MNDFILGSDLVPGVQSPKVKLIQEWLCLNGILVNIDSDFGPATEQAVRAFQRQAGLPATGQVDNNTFTLLIRPAARALSPIAPAPGLTTLGTLIVAYAHQHLAERPREVGGQNRGPWVRLYMDGNEGDAWAWCAGFAMTVMKQACGSLGLPYSLDPSFSCDELAKRASKAGLLLPERDAAKPGALKSGSLFLVRRTASDWTHVGIVTELHDGSFGTIEGNTNDEGSREGYEVCARTRGYKDKDFIVWS